MKVILTFLCLLLCVETFASLTNYPSVRDYVEKHNLNDQISATNRIFIEFGWKDSAIVQFHEGMKLDEAIKQTKFKDKYVLIFVFRYDKRPYEYSTLVYASTDGKNIKSSDFVLHPLDAIDLTDTADIN